VVKKVRVGIVFGGRSIEHEVSILSARSIIEALDKDKYELVLIGIDKEGGWHLQEDSAAHLLGKELKQITQHKDKEPLSIVPQRSEGTLVHASSGKSPAIDVVFPVLHGPYGEDGTIQGLLKMARIPFIGAGVLASAAGMDKEIMKRLFKEAGLPTARFITVRRHKRDCYCFKDVVSQVGLPFFVKPANAGSSVGVSKVKTEEDFLKAMNEAFSYDHKILIEEYIVGREIECSVLGNEDPMASLPGELIPQHEFYSYEAKYLDEQGAQFVIPARLETHWQHQIQELAIRAFQAICCEGMARVDFFLTPDGKLFVNEINTIPGFTKISMYPKMWEVSGLPYGELLDRLIQLALERDNQDKQVQTSHQIGS